MSVRKAEAAGSQKIVLVVDDDIHILEVLEARLASVQFKVLTATGGKEALEILRSAHIDLMISDIRMPGIGGMELLTEVLALRPDLPVILLTAYGNIPDAVHSVKAGALDYITKPFDGRELVRKATEILNKPATGAEAPPAKSARAAQDRIAWGGKSAVMKELHDVIERIAPSDVNILLLGESGVGKERIARLIHQSGPRREHPFVVVDCGSTPTGLLESELFGHVRGSFTHAIRDKKGLIEAADGGTLLLDEVGNISSEMQVRLLRFLEERKIRRIGDIREIPIDCRVIAATNVNLPAEVEAGNFREDLYYRLRVVTIKIPPLRERREDIPFLAQYFVETFCKSQGNPLIKLPPEIIEWLKAYPWPGNVRELKNALEAGMVLCREGILRLKDLQLAGLPFDAPLHVGTGRSASLSLDDSERNAILRALKEASWVQKDAAQLLGISRRALHYKIKKYGIDFSGKKSGMGDEVSNH